MVSVRQSPETSYTPTAHASFADSETTPFRSRKFDPGLGLGTTVHWLPAQRSVNEVGPLSPTAQMVPSGEADTARNVVENPAFGLSTRVHCDPFQWSVSVELPSSPTAQTSFDASAVTP